MITTSRAVALLLTAATLLLGAPAQAAHHPDRDRDRPPAKTKTMKTKTIKKTATTDPGPGAADLPNPPGAPTGVGATPGSGQATVTWTAPSEQGDGVTGYHATASAQGGGGQACAAATKISCQPPTTCSAGPVTTTCTITGLTNGVTYSVFVRAASPGGYSQDSDSVLVTPAVAQPLPATTPATPDGVLASSAGSRLTNGPVVTTLSGAGFAPNTPVVLGLPGSPSALGQAVTDQTGAFSSAVTLPAGTHTVVALGLATGGGVRTLALTFTTTAALAVTGPPVGALILAGLLLLAVGAAIRIRARRA